MGPSSFLSDLMVASSEYEETWRGKDENSNPRQIHYSDMILEQNTAQLEVEIRKVCRFYKNPADSIIDYR